MTILNDIPVKDHNKVFQKNDFEKLYIASRKNENRVYTDEQLRILPSIEPSHVHYTEWQVRKRSALRVLNYLKKKDKSFTALDMGCGNGWLSHLLADQTNSFIAAIDINTAELNQAKSVFGKKANLRFMEGSINNIDCKQKFDIIIFAASIQYFPSFDDTIIKALSLLSEEGEIHILDSPFYKAAEIENARQRTRLYYESAGYPEMAAYYFHHSIDSLRGFAHELLFEPGSLKNKLTGNKDPFPWICITDK